MIPQEKTKVEISNQINLFLDSLNSHLVDYYRLHYSNLEIPVIDRSKGSKYTKLESSKSVYGFIDNNTGDILMAACYARPAKGVRGNIFNDGYDIEKCCGPHGVNYKGVTENQWIQ